MRHCFPFSPVGVTFKKTMKQMIMIIWSRPQNKREFRIFYGQTSNKKHSNWGRPEIKEYTSHTSTLHRGGDVFPRLSSISIRKTGDGSLRPRDQAEPSSTCEMFRPSTLLSFKSSCKCWRFFNGPRGSSSLQQWAQPISITVQQSSRLLMGLLL